MAPKPFKVSADEIGRIVGKWGEEATKVHHISYSDFGGARGDGSAVAAALKSAELPATMANTSIAMRLDAISKSLAKFNAQTQESDGDSAAAFDKLKPR